MVPRGGNLRDDGNEWLIVMYGPNELIRAPKLLYTATVEDYYYYYYYVPNV